MTMTAQVLFGSGFLTLCTLLHVAILVGIIPVLTRLSASLETAGLALRTGVLVSVNVLAILCAHTVQIWFWAFVYRAVGIFPDIETSFYFATVTYTTLGYGDIVLGEGLRIFATFGAITGLLTFGISTAFLIGVISRVLVVLEGGRHGP